MVGASGIHLKNVEGLVLFGYRWAIMASMWCCLVWFANVPRQRLPTEVVHRWMGLLFVGLIAFGYLVLVAGTFEAPSVLQLCLLYTSSAASPEGAHSTSSERSCTAPPTSRCSGCCLLYTSTSALIPLYAVGVFTGFTLSQTGMVRHHLKLKEPNWKRKAVVNGVGAVMTAVVDVYKRQSRR